jgi:predicted molibdopterin-dependent oxidoreductase YjgC
LAIDGIEVVVERGKTILEAAQSAGIRIPTLCHDRRLIPFGACRLCVVQQKGKSELLPSCFTPAKDGMEILTQSPRISESRRLQLQLILLNHPMICPRCEKEGECVLQNLIYEYGVEERLYPWEPMKFPADDHSVLLQRDSNKCILCGRCARICDEVQGVGELSFTRRGIKTAIDTDFHRPIQCEFCGQCMDTCPVGAITSNRFDYTAKSWELEETTTPCPYCGCGCLLTMGSKDGEIKRVFSDPDRGPSDGNLCVRGRFGWDFVDHPERIKTPLLRVNGAFKEASWDEVLQFIVRQFEEAKDQYGPEAIAGMASSRLTNEEHYLFQKLFQDAVGTNQISYGGDSASRGLTEGLAKTLGIGASTNSIQEIRKADCILVIGVDPAATHPIIKNEIQLAIRRNRAQLIVLGSHDIGLTRVTQISPMFHPGITLIDKPGTEVSLLNAVIGTILREGLEDKGFIAENTQGIEELRKKTVAPPASKDDKDEWPGILPEAKKTEIEKAARAFAQAKKAMILIGSGFWSHLPPKEIAMAASNLVLITGHLGKESSGILLLLDKCNAQGAIDMGDGAKGGGWGLKDLIQKAEEGKLRAVYIVGENPLITYPDTDRLKKALKNLPCLIVQDLFMTDTAKIAHVVLPASAFVEKSGTFTNLERRVQKLNPLRPSLGQSKSDLEIFLQLLMLFESPVPGDTPEAVFDEICLHIPYYQDIQDGEQWPKGSPFLYANGFPNGKAKLIPVEGKRTLSNLEGYPFQLVQRPSLFQSGQLSSRSDSLKKVSEKPHLEMNPDDAQRLKIEDGEFVQVTSQKGQSLKMNVKYSSRPALGVITAPTPCPIMEEGGFCSVEVEKIWKGGN